MTDHAPEKVVCDACWSRRGGGGAPPSDCTECGGRGMVPRPPDHVALTDEELAKVADWVDRSYPRELSTGPGQLLRRLIAALRDARDENARVEREMARLRQHMPVADEVAFILGDAPVRAVADNLAVALHHCSMFLPLLASPGPRLDNAIAVAAQVQIAMDAYCTLTGTRRQELTDRTVTKDAID